MFVDPIARHSNFLDYSRQHLVVNTRECTCEVVVLLQPRPQGAFPKAKESDLGKSLVLLIKPIIFLTFSFLLLRGMFKFLIFPAKQEEVM